MAPPGGCIIPKAAIRAIDVLVANAILNAGDIMVTGKYVELIAIHPDRVEPSITFLGWAGAASPRLYCKVVKAPKGPVHEHEY
jgi:hypothetical protein